MLKTKVSLLLVFTIVAGTLLFLLRDAWSLNPFQNEEAYTNISRAVFDREGAVYTITDSRKLLRKASPTGELIYAIDSSQQAALDTIQLFNHVTSDEAGNAYALITILDSYGLKVLGERIVMVSPDGSAVNSLYETTYTAADNLLRVGNIQLLAVDNGSVYFVLLDQGNASLLRIDADVNGTAGTTAAPLVPETVRTLAMPENRYLNEVAGYRPDQLFFTTKRGLLYAVDSSNQADQIYPQSGAEQLNVPVGIITSDHTHVYYIDYHDQAIKRLSAREPGLAAETLLTMDRLASEYPDRTWAEFTDLSITSGLIAVTTADQLVRMNASGEIVSVHSSFHYPLSAMWSALGYWLLIACFSGMVLLTLRFLYVRVMQRKVSLLLKQLALIVPVVLLSMLGLAYSVHLAFSNEMRVDTMNQLELLAGNGKNLVDGASLQQLDSPNDYMSDGYQQIRTSMNDLFAQTGEGRDGLYSTIYRYMNGSLYIIMDDDDSVTMFQPFPLSEENLLVLEGGEVVSGEWEDSTGQWMYALGPLYGPQGEIIGIYETGKDMVGMTQSQERILSNVLKMIALIGVVLLIVISLMSVYMLSSIRKLRRNVNLIASGEWDVEVQIRTRDEVAELGERFNMMARSIRRYIEEVTKLSNSYFRFVPQQFLKVLGKTNMTQIQLGEQATRHMTIMVCQMRRFDEFSGKLTTEENFKFINSFLKVFGPIIRKFGGFTSRYLGPGMLTMFPNDSGAAMKAAIAMRSQLETYNAGRAKAKFKPIDLGIAVHSGDVMIGIIGEEQRMEGSVVSNHVQLTHELEKASGKLGVAILLTDNTIRTAKKGVPGQYRKLGAIQLDEEQRALELYDLYEADPPHVRKLKHETRQRFEEAVELFREGRFHDARERFVDVVKKNRHDLAAKLYFFACDRYYREGVADDWNHALRLSSFHLKEDATDVTITTNSIAQSV